MRMIKLYHTVYPSFKYFHFVSLRNKYNPVVLTSSREVFLFDCCHVYI